jgi:hypothetical protein
MIAKVGQNACSLSDRMEADEARLGGGDRVAKEGVGIVEVGVSVFSIFVTVFDFRLILGVL